MSLRPLGHINRFLNLTPFYSLFRLNKLGNGLIYFMPFDVPDTFTEGCSWPKNTGTAKNRKRVQGGWMLLLLANVWQE